MNAEDAILAEIQKAFPERDWTIHRHATKGGCWAVMSKSPTVVRAGVEFFGVPFSLDVAVRDLSGLIRDQCQ